jgi:hypothetical protein
LSRKAEPSTGHSESSLIRSATCVAFFVVCGAILAIAWAARFRISSVWDDAYFAVRYADNWLATGVPAWNRGDAPTFGLTSLMYLMVVVPLRAITPSSPALAASLSSLLSGVGFFVSLLWLTGRVSVSALPRRWAAGLGMFTLAAASASLADHLTSGMDTTFAMAFLTIYLALLEERSQRDAAGLDLIAGAWAGLAFLARPDLLLLTLGPLVSAFLLSARTDERRRALRMLMVAGSVLGFEAALAASYFSSPLPLPFFAKATGLYGPSIHATYAGVAGAQLKQFGVAHWHLFALILLPSRVAPRKWWREMPAVEKGLMIGSALFLGYHALFVLPIMAFSQRFYYPVLPALIYLALRATGRLIEQARNSGTKDRFGKTGSILLALIVVVSLVRTAVSEWRVFETSLSNGTTGRFSVVEHFQTAGLAKVWPGLEVIASLPDDLVVAATEVGFPAAMNPDKRIIDLSGLNHADIALGRLSPATVLSESRPDVIYLPHPDYREMNQRIRDEPGLLSGYRLASPPEGPPALRLAVRRNSPYIAKLEGLLTLDSSRDAKSGVDSRREDHSPRR